MEPLHGLSVENPFDCGRKDVSWRRSVASVNKVGDLGTIPTYCGCYHREFNIAPVLLGDEGLNQAKLV